MVDLIFHIEQLRCVCDMGSKEQRKSANKPRVSDVRVCAHSHHTTEHGYPDLSTKASLLETGDLNGDLNRTLLSSSGAHSIPSIALYLEKQSQCGTPATHSVRGLCRLGKRGVGSL